MTYNELLDWLVHTPWALQVLADDTLCDRIVVEGRVVYEREQEDTQETT